MRQLNGVLTQWSNRSHHRTELKKSQLHLLRASK
jgi:hypothetical protein